MPFRVLVVDDAAFVRDTIKRTLRQFIPDVEIFDAVDGNRAVAIMKYNNMDLIFSDWEMPEMTGEQFLHWVRSQAESRTTPFIMVSSRGDRDHVIAAAQAGVSDYLTKPFSPDELKRKFAKQLKKIGYKAPNKTAAPSGENGYSSLDVLTGSKASAIQKPRTVTSAAGFGKPVAPNPTTKANGQFEGRAQLRFPNGTCECVIRELSLQAMSGFMVRPENMPSLFDQAVVDIENDKGEAVARINAYLHSMQAVEPRPDTQKIKFTIRFVDNDSDKFEVLSKMIARTN